MIACRAAVASGLLGLLAGCVDYGTLGYSAVPFANAPPFAPGGGSAAAPPTIDQFTAALAPFGQWLQAPQWGLVWRPQVGPGWQPYTVGRWLDDPAYGRTWLGDEPWSWATDHYGRWGFDSQLGWVWVPGTQWAPAWVAWRDGSDVAGWAPLPPVTGFGGGYGSFGFDSWGYDQWYAPSWVFVPRGAVYAPYPQRQRAPRQRDRDDWNATRPVPPRHHGGQHAGNGRHDDGRHNGNQAGTRRGGSAADGDRPSPPNPTSARPPTGDRPTRGQSPSPPAQAAQAAPPAPAAPPSRPAASPPQRGPGHELAPKQPE